MNQTFADLHLHTIHSDGKYTAKEVVERAVTAGIKVLSITDHDTIDGLNEAVSVCGTHGIGIIPGAEISAEAQGSEVHLLAYAFEASSEVLGQLFQAQRESRRDRAAAFIVKLREAGLKIPPADEFVDRIEGSVGRPHLAQLIIEAGSAHSMSDAFEKYLTDGTATFVPKWFPSSRDVIRTVHAASGYCVVAHPGHFTSHGVMLRLIDDGLDGVEVNHPSHEEHLVTYYGEFAERHDLIKTGGSDYHGWRDGDDENLGKYFAPWPLSGNLLNSRTL